jgi:hypothetical protein
MIFGRIPIYRKTFTMKFEAHITSGELERILAKQHDELSQEERNVLLHLYESSQVRGPVAPISREKIASLLAKPFQELTDEDRATLIAFRGQMNAARFLLSEAARLKGEAA